MRVVCTSTTDEYFYFDTENAAREFFDDFTIEIDECDPDEETMYVFLEIFDDYIGYNAIDDFDCVQKFMSKWEEDIEPDVHYSIEDGDIHIDDMVYTWYEMRVEYHERRTAAANDPGVPGENVIPYENDEQEKAAFNADPAAQIDHGPFTDYLGREFQHSFRVVITPDGDLFEIPVIREEDFIHIDPDHENWESVNDFYDEEDMPKTAWYSNLNQGFWDAELGPPRVAQIGCSKFNQDGNPTYSEIDMTDFGIELYNTLGEVNKMPTCEYDAQCILNPVPLKFKVEDGNYVVDDDGNNYMVSGTGDCEYVCRRCCENYLIEELAGMSVEQKKDAAELEMTPLQMLADNGDFSIPEGEPELVINGEGTSVVPTETGGEAGSDDELDERDPMERMAKAVVDRRVLADQKEDPEKKSILDTFENVPDTRVVVHAGQIQESLNGIGGITTMKEIKKKEKVFQGLKGRVDHEAILQTYLDKVLRYTRDELMALPNGSREFVTWTGDVVTYLVARAILFEHPFGLAPVSNEHLDLAGAGPAAD